MGSASSKSTLSITNDIVNKAIFDFSQNYQVKTENNVMVTQSINLAGAKIYGCEIEVENIADISSTVLQEFSQESTTELTNSITTALSTAAENAGSASAGFLSTGAANSDVNTVINNRARNIIDNTLTMDTLNELVNKVNLNQSIEGEDLVYDPCGYEILLKYGYPPATALAECKDATGKLPKCRFSNDARIEMFSQQAASIVTSALVDNDVLADVSTDASQSSSAEATGPLGEIADIFGAFMLPSVVSAVGAMFVLIALVMVGPSILKAMRGTNSSK